MIHITYFLVSIIQQPRWTVTHVKKETTGGLYRQEAVWLPVKPVWTTALFAVYRCPKASCTLTFSRCEPIKIPYWPFSSWAHMWVLETVLNVSDVFVIINQQRFGPFYSTSTVKILDFWNITVLGLYISVKPFSFLYIFFVNNNKLHEVISQYTGNRNFRNRHNHNWNFTTVSMVTSHNI